jgi:hypothetical protein
MKILKIHHLIEDKQLLKSRECKKLVKEVYAAIKAIKWPPNSKHFTLNPTRRGNGVKPIKEGFQQYLLQRGWQIEYRMELATRKKPGPVDVVKQLSDGRYFAVEWETGNISSSHRALNKMTIGLANQILAYGILILPSREMYQWLTDRVGNFEEMEPYFAIWENHSSVKSGVLAIVEIEHDKTSRRVRMIEKGTDGRALI